MITRKKTKDTTPACLGNGSRSTAPAPPLSHPPNSQLERIPHPPTSRGREPHNDTRTRPLLSFLLPPAAKVIRKFPPWMSTFLVRQGRHETHRPNCHPTQRHNGNPTPRLASPPFQHHRWAPPSWERDPTLAAGGHQTGGAPVLATGKSSWAAGGGPYAAAPRPKPPHNGSSGRRPPTCPARAPGRRQVPHPPRRATF